ncbi:GNAT family N-acetyltransferase [Parasphingorhabdus litoris]|uniref:GNAT family N-acetyltransferase n=1 Tax=Parasphingorhabdus litoris TaxID=394733 RepID=UPI001E553DDF|nr:GNAT family N-acetyltransferase [Parasphingorhabdus litoris]
MSLLRQSTAEAVGLPNNRDFAITLSHPRTGDLMGGLWGQSRWNIFFVDILSVAGDLRGQGLGSQLMEMAEAEARNRQCSLMWLDTYAFQARPFYERHGFEVFAQFDGAPPIYPQYFMKKSLD